MSERYEAISHERRWVVFDNLRLEPLDNYAERGFAEIATHAMNLAHERSGAEELRKALEEAPEALANPSEDWAEKYANWYEDRRYFLAKWTPKP